MHSSGRSRVQLLFFVPGHPPMCKCCCFVFQNKPSLVESGCGLSFSFARPVLSLRPLCLREPLALIACDCGRTGGHWQCGRVAIKLSCLVALCSLPLIVAGRAAIGKSCIAGVAKKRRVIVVASRVFVYKGRRPQQCRSFSEHLRGTTTRGRGGEGAPGSSEHCPTVLRTFSVQQLPRGRCCGGAPTSSEHCPNLFRTCRGNHWGRGGGRGTQQFRTFQDIVRTFSVEPPTRGGGV